MLSVTSNNKFFDLKYKLNLVISGKSWLLNQVYNLFTTFLY